MPGITFARLQPVGTGLPTTEHLELAPTSPADLARQAGARPGEVEAGPAVVRQLELAERVRPRVLEEVSRQLQIALPTLRKSKVIAAAGDTTRVSLDDGGEIYAGPAEIVRHDSGAGSYINLLNADMSSSLGFSSLAWFWARVDAANSAGLYMIEVHVGGSGETLTVQVGYGGKGTQYTGTSTRSGNTFRYVCDIGATNWITVQIGPGLTGASYVQFFSVDITKLT